MKLKRTHYCGKLSIENQGQKVIISGFVKKVRNLGHLIFMDIRDISGLIQIAFDKTNSSNILKLAEETRCEFVISAEGIIRKRSSINNTIKNGDIELYIFDFEVLSKADTPPFEIIDNVNAREELRLKYRYLDLRRPELQNIISLRHKVSKAVRNYYDKNGFLEIETPILIKSTPEGARDYLVPSRVNLGKFFALPQSPQLYKQLLMVAGYDRYFQIAHCFRDEDLRADRQPEFTQIDMEMSFVDEDDIMSMNEGLIKYLFKEVMGINISIPLKKLSYKEAMERFGSDKPDTRYGLELIDISDIVKNCAFKVFSDAIKNGGSVRCINVKNSANSITRKEIDKLTEVIKEYHAKGLAFSRYSEDKISSSFEKFLSKDEISLLYKTVNLESNDVVLIVADTNNDIVLGSLGNLRRHLAKMLSLIPENKFDFLWIKDFPLLEYDQNIKRYVSKHHPFTLPKLEHLDKLDKDPMNVTACAYDMVLNGCEIGGGSIRIHDTELQKKIFSILGLPKEVIQERFGFLLDAFKYGVPPHGGMAYGLDRLVMLMAGKESVRDVIAFPKVQNSSELMTNCPSYVDQINLDELHISIKYPKE